MLLLFLTVTFVACKKDHLIESNNIDETPLLNGVSKSMVDDFALTTNKISVQNGVLVFEDIETLDAVTNSLVALSQNNNSIESAITALGFSISDPEDDDLEPEFPIFTQFANRYSGFNSLIEKICSDRATLLESGGLVKDITPHFTADPYLQAVLNENLEIKIEGIIYKLLDEHRTVVITDGDFAKLDVVRQNPENFTPQENIFIHDELDPRMEDKIRLFDEEGNKTVFGCVASFYPVNIGAHNFSFVSNSFFIFGGNNNITYDWDFGDGTTFSGTGVQGMAVNHTFSPNNYPYTVRLEISSPTGCSSSYAFLINDPNSCSAQLEVRRIPNNGKAFRFIASNVSGSGLSYT